MRFVSVATAVLTCLLQTVPAASEAQSCFGFASFRESPFQVSGGVTANSRVRNVATSLRGGHKLFGGFKTGITRYQELEGSSNDISAFAGYETALDHAARILVCPNASLFASTGPIDVFASGIDFRTLGASGGLGVGATAVRSRRFVLLPSVVLLIRYASSTVMDHPLNTDFPHATTYGIFEAGASLVVNRTFTVRPGISAPFGLHNPNADLPYPLYYAKASWTLDVALSFGRRGPHPR